MKVRSLILASLLMAGIAQAAESVSPLAQDRGQSRPLIIIARTAMDPTLTRLQKDLQEPANKQAFKDRNMVLYTVINTIGQRDGKDLDPQSTMALIRGLKLGVLSDAKVILVGKDGETKLDHTGAIEPQLLFSTVDQLPQAEKDMAPPAPVVVESKPGVAGKGAKPVKEVKQLDD